MTEDNHSTALDVLVIGGTPAHPGGVEAFCDRSSAAIAARGGAVRMTVEPAGTAFLPLRRLPDYIHRLARLFARRHPRPDGVWVQYVNLPDLGYVAAAKMAGYKVMVTPHLGSNWRSQERPILRRISRMLIGQADRLALISRTQELEIDLPHDVPRSLIRNFLPEALWADPVPPANSGDALQLIHSGRLSEGKGTFLFVELCAALRDRGVPFHARITGGADAATMDRLNTMIRDLDLGPHVEVLGRVPDDELLRRLREADMLVHLSRSDSYPLIVLEALSCGTYPLCMELAGARDMVESYAGKVVSAQSPVAEAAEFIEGAHSNEIRGAAREAAERVRRDYAWSNCAAALEAALRNAFA